MKLEWGFGGRLNQTVPPRKNKVRAIYRLHADRLLVIVSTYALLGIDSGFTAMSSGVCGKVNLTGWVRTKFSNAVRALAARLV